MTNYFGNFLGEVFTFGFLLFLGLTIINGIGSLRDFFKYRVRNR